ncbi:hypothetical protein SARC_11308 [Sphaeroforma arctica JP610]|uniref:PPM-type phosphatase domain-containing protein n=1 Tax=Sphaeroforma arctica JP610 TaxID=667725 RepID=A0A0L0FHF7_9EUKA|nr:hypothetical protein SARC_11308 [Sphaeroforma arctica JP610]KNC76180.1 hypothetical protein SARC_11308 [Sphaeroforma arctica JP610]|eukprot:XP_014150082.1 hypothetical protein SARC_11308 [Sphaeroforma arctica JP610]
MSSSRTTRARASSPNLHPQLYQADGPVPTTSTPVPTPSAQVDPSEGSALYPEGPTSAIQSVLAQAHTPTSEDRARRHLVIDTGGAGAPGLSQVQVHDCDCDGKGKGEREHSADVCCQATRGGANKTDKEAKNSITQSLPTITRTSMTPHTADDEGAGGLVFTLRQTSDSAGQSINSTAGDTDKTSTSVKSSPAEASKHTRTDEPFNYSASPNTPQSPSGTPTENSIGLIKQNSSPTPTSTSGQEFKLQPQTGMGRRFSNSNISYFPHSRSNLGIERKELLHSARSQPGSDTPSPGKSPTRAHTHTHTHSTHRQSFTPTRAPGEDASTTTLNAATPTHNDTVAMATSATTGPTDGRQTSQGSANSALSSASHERRDSWGVPQPHRRYSNASLLARQAAAAAAAAASPHNRSMTSLGSTEGVVKLNNAHTASSFVEKQGVVLRGGRVADGKVNGISRTTRALGSANCGPGVACDPETFVQPLEISVPHVVVIATSGLWDFCTISQVRKFLMDHLTFSEDQDLDALAGEVVKLAKGLNKAVEDVTVLLILVLPGRATGGSPRVSGESTTSATNGSLGKGLQQKSSGSLKLGARIARRFSNSSTQSNGNTSSKATASHDQHTARRASIDEGRDEEVPKGTHGGKHAHTSTPPQPPQDVQSTAGQVRRDLGSVSYEGRTSDLSQLTGLGMPLTGMTSSSDTLRAAVSGMKARRASADSTASVGSSGGRMHRYTSYACPLVNATVGSATRAQGQGQTPALNSAAPVQLQQSVSNYIQPVPDAPRSAFKSSMYDDLMKSKAADTNGSHGSHGGLAGGKVSKGVKCGTENGTVVKSASGKKKKIDIIKGREGRGLSEVEEVEDVVYDSPPPPLGCIKGFKMNP